MQQNPTKSSATQLMDKIKFQYNNHVLHIDYYTTNNLPIFYGVHSSDSSSAVDSSSFEASEANVCVTSVTNQNLSPSQKELLRWHFRLGHLNFTIIQQVLKGGWIGASDLISAASRCEHPKCASCQLSKAKRRPTGSVTSKATNNTSIKLNDLRPGQRVSMDHFQ
jgi:hypothetical protein